MLLLDLQPGQKARVVKINKGRGERKLYEIGLVPGTVVEVISRHPFKGPMVLRIDNAEFALGHKLAGSILVSRD